MKVLQVKKFPLYDIFVGNGWKHHTRVKLNKNGTVTHLSGQHLSSANLTSFLLLLEMKKEK